MSTYKENSGHADRTQDVLTGPPGLLFGLTLLVFLFAGIYFSWVPASSTNEASRCDASLAAPR